LIKPAALIGASPLIALIKLIENIHNKRNPIGEAEPNQPINLINSEAKSTNQQRSEINQST
jgi:hypothetical protein